MTIDDIIWEMPPHTEAKHFILKKYVQAWAPILANGATDKRLVYIDGFAGPGEYKGGQDGSPVIVLKSLKDHSLKDSFHAEFYNLFIEKRRDRADNLKGAIESRVGQLPPWIKYEVVNGEFRNEISKILEDLKNKGKELAPCLCFVDPFGWSDLDYDLLSSIMKFNKAELLITFVAGYIQRFVWDPFHEQSISKLFNQSQIEEIKNSTEQEKTILRLFLENLQQKIRYNSNGSHLFNLSFSAYNKGNRLEYYLIHLTKHCSGFRAMKQAMYAVAKDGSYKFSDFNFVPGQNTLIDYGMDGNWINKASDEVLNYLQERSKTGYREVPIKEVKEYIDCKTNFKYHTKILGGLELNNKIKVLIENRRKGTFPERGYLVLS